MNISYIPFTVYDFFGYLVSGFLSIFGFSYIFCDGLFCFGDLNTFGWAALISVSYILGHILSSLAKWIYELNIVKKKLKYPYINLFINRSTKLKRLFFPEYFDAFPADIIKSILATSKIDESPKNEEILKSFYHRAIGKYKSDDKIVGRLDTYLVLYGFCRNISFTLLILAIMFVLGFIIRKSPSWELIIYGLISLGAAFVLFLRYLKFLRYYSYELFLSYL